MSPDRAAISSRRTLLIALSTVVAAGLAAKRTAEAVTTNHRVTSRLTISCEGH